MWRLFLFKFIAWYSLVSSVFIASKRAYYLEPFAKITGAIIGNAVCVGSNFLLLEGLLSRVNRQLWIILWFAQETELERVAS